MKVLSWNCNGFKTAWERNKIQELLMEEQPDVLCLQETKILPIHIGNRIEEFNPKSKSFSVASSYKSGYAGVSNILNYETWAHSSLISYPVELMDGYGSGRIVCTELRIGKHDVKLINVYTMNSGSGKDELRKKWNDEFTDYIEDQQEQDYEVIIIGDLNVVPTANDYWGNYAPSPDNQPGMKDYEVEHFHQLVKDNKLVDVLRELSPEEKLYTWYSNWDKKKTHGWRLDHCLMSQSLYNSCNVGFKIIDKPWQDHQPFVVEIIPYKYDC